MGAYREGPQKSRNEKQALISGPLAVIVHARNSQPKGICNLLKAKKKRLKSGLVVVLCLLIGVPVIGVVSMRMEGGAPELEVGLVTNSIGASQTLPISVTDTKSGIRMIWVALYKDGRETVLFEETLPSRGIGQGGDQFTKLYNIEIEPRKVGLSDGKALLRVVVRDHSWRHLGHGNKTYLEKEVLIDTIPPEVNMVSHVHNISQGGAGLVLYRLSEACPVSGVAVGEHFYPGQPGPFGDPTVHMAFMALAHDHAPETEVHVKAVDSAGNASRKGFHLYIKKRKFKQDVIRLSDGFFRRKLPEFENVIPAQIGASPVDRFVYINRDLRALNYQTVSELVQVTDPKIYWSKAFSRLPGSAKQAGFGDRRDYKYQGQVIDRQVHLGIDLASTAQSPVPAANRGKVAFAGSLGIYGQSVMIDHGYGVFSMYAHLSSMAVEPGQIVKRGAIIGTTGMTGMAGGDHLHFSMLIHDTFVNPREWWDMAWIQNNITNKIEQAQASLRSG